MNKPYIILILLLLSSIFGLELIAQESWIKYLTIDPIIHQGSNTDETLDETHSIWIKDEKFGSAEWGLIDTIHEVQNRAFLEVIEDPTNTNIEEGSYNIEIKIEKWMSGDDPEGPPCDTCTQYKILTVDYFPESQLTISNGLLHFEGAHQLKYTIINTSSLTNAPTMRLTGEIMVDREYSYDCETSPGGLGVLSKDANFLTLIWTKEMPGPDEYDLEWSFYHRDSEVGKWVENGEGPANYNFSTLFKNNTTRVSIDGMESTYKINLIYPTGYIFYRIRGAINTHEVNAVGKLQAVRKYGKWSEDLEPSSTIAEFKHKTSIEWHENETINFQGSVAYAEDGKNVPSVQYFDGTLRQRQSAVLSNSDNKTTYTQTIYDYHGRPAVQTIPAPASHNLLKFEVNFAANEDGIAYNRMNFDTGMCMPLIDEISTDKGVGQYYSPENPLANTGVHQYIPDAEGFPFTVTEFTPDLTGRVRQQSGVGKEFQLAGKRKTVYLYGKPAQWELDRLFGNDVGNANHYLKNAVIDPNEQASISYIDAHGRVVATSLAGEKPDNVEPLEGGIPEPSLITRDLLKNERDGLSIVSVDKLIVVVPGIYTFDYQMPRTKFDDPCSELCYDCVYEVEITISDADCNLFYEGSVGEPFVKTVQNFTLSDEIVPTCDFTTDINVHFALKGTEMELPKGEYTITKKLKLSDASLRKATEHYMATNDCLESLAQLTVSYESEIDISGCQLDCEVCETSEPIGSLRNRLIGKYGRNSEVSHFTSEEMQNLELMLYCEELCTVPTECEVVYESMLSDLTPPFGQYAQLNPEIPDPFSIFYDNGAMDLPYYQNLPDGTVYQDEEGNEAFIIGEDGALISPETLSPEDFTLHFQPSWAIALLPFHREYCVYENWCTGQTSINNDQWNRDLEQTTSFQQAVELGFINDRSTETLVIDDPFFTTEPGLSCKADLDALLLDIIPSDQESLTLLEFIQNMVYGCNTVLGQGNVTEADFAWSLYKTFYLSYKLQVITKKREQDCPFIKCIGIENSGCELGVILPTLEGKVRRFPNFGELERLLDGKLPQPGEDPPISKADAEELSAEAEAQIISDCQTSCEQNADIWLGELTACSLTEDDLVDLRERLIAVCQAGCDIAHPLGASSIPPGTPKINGEDSSFYDILLEYTNICDADCNPNSITSLLPYNAYKGPRTELTLNNTCACAKLNEVEEYYEVFAEEDETLRDYLAKFSEFTLTEFELTTFQEYCDGTNNSTILPRAVQIPAYLECDVCVEYEEIEPLIEAFKLDYSENCADSEEDFYDLMAEHLNQLLGFNLRGQNYYDFERNHNNESMPGDFYYGVPLLCPNAPNPDLTDINPCITALYTQAVSNAKLKYQALQADLQREFQKEYLKKCMNTMGELFTATSYNQEYHYTLYYYDQAGNLVQTVPPNGVKVLDENDIPAVDLYRKNPKNIANQATYPNHTFLTQYKYNTLNQVTNQISPDTEEKLFWYDRIGRLVVSQDGRQRYKSPVNADGSITKDENGNFIPILRSTPLYSYTLYDDLGRITEVGEIATNSTITHQIAMDTALLGAWTRSGTKTEVTRTYYDDVKFPIPVLENQISADLRTRVTATTFTEVLNPEDDTDYDYATHYDYDITGNVKKMVQEFTALHDFGNSGDPTTYDPATDQGFKTIEYDYDYISGNVNAVFYQKGKADQFSHQYLYDSNNRLINALTSAEETQLNMMDWENDASYQYYLHGPLSRQELGKRKVQGCDFAYTLQGWIKGVNSNALMPDKDIGGDGYLINGVSKDILGYTLGYYDGDYTSISGKQFELNLENSSLNSAAKNLYNGNIRYMSIHNEKFEQPIAYSYSYDQLHRIKSMQSFENADLDLFQWNPSGNTVNFGMTAQYDGNGNIKALTRDALLPEAAQIHRIHDLEYSYGTNGQGEVINNLLFSTEDSATELICEDDTTVDDPAACGLISSNNTIVIKTILDGTKEIIVKTGQRICLEPGFGLNGIGGRFSAQTMEDCEPAVTDPKLSEYCYDGNGNMVLNSDKAVINWSPYGKVKNVTLEGETQSGPGNIDIVITEPITEATTIQACNTITANSSIAGTPQVNFEAGECITLLEGFVAKPSATGGFTAKIVSPSMECVASTLEKPRTEFGYDAAQNRVLKSITNPDGSTTQTYYIRDVQGNMMATYEVEENTLEWKEQFLYGTSRLGVFLANVELDETTKNPYFVENNTFSAGRKHYELSNHLGNVLSVVSDIRSTLGGGTGELVSKVISAKDYYPFGLDIPGREFENSIAIVKNDYRFGFNGKEVDKDGAWGGSTNYDYGFRIYNPEIARFLSVDPLTSSYPWYTPYQFAGNMPIWAIDLDGLEPTKPKLYWEEKPELEKKAWGDLPGIYLFRTQGIHSSDDYMQGASTMYVVERHDAIFEINNTDPNDIAISYEYWDNHQKQWIAFDPTDIADPEEVKDIALYSIGATGLLAVGAHAGVISMQSFGLNASFEIGASLLVNHDLSGVDAADIYTGSILGIKKYEWLAKATLGAFFDAKSEGYSSVGGYFGGDYKGGGAILTDYFISGFGEGLDFVGKYASGILEESGKAFNRDALKAWRNKGQLFPSSNRFGAPYGQVLDDIGNFHSLGLPSFIRGDNLIKSSKFIQESSSYFSQGTTSILDDIIGNLQSN